MYKKIISVILAFAFLIQSIPPAFAQPISETNTSSPLISNNKESVSELPYIIQEDTSLREEFSKTFVLSDGTYMVATYPSSVHYQTETGDWQQINNALTQTNTLFAGENASVYRTADESSSLDVAFNASLASGNIFSVSNSEHTVSLNLVDPDSVKDSVVAIETPILPLPEIDSSFQNQGSEESVSGNSTATDDAEVTVPIDDPNKLIETESEVVDTPDAQPVTPNSVPESSAAAEAPVTSSPETKSSPQNEVSNEVLSDDTTMSDDSVVITQAEGSGTDLDVTGETESETNGDPDETQPATPNSTSQGEDLSATTSPAETIPNNSNSDSDSDSESVASSENISAIPADSSEVAIEENTQTIEDSTPIDTVETPLADSVAAEDISSVEPITDTPIEVPSVEPEEPEAAEPVTEIAPDVILPSDNIEQPLLEIKALTELYPELLTNEISEKAAAIQIVSTQTAPAADAENLPLSELVQNPEALAVDNLYQQILYEDVFENVDLEYIVSDQTVKENIIVKAPLDNYQFAFELNLDGLDYIINTDRSISLNNAQGVTEFTIQRPVMFDANGLVSDSVSYNIVENAGTNYIIVYADKEWCNTAEFPISIDPTISQQVNINSSLRSSYVTESASHPNATLIAAGRLPGENKRLRGYVKFNLPSMPDGSIVNRAYLQFAVEEVYDYTGADPRIHTAAYLCPADWNASTITWASQPGQPNRNPKEYLELVDAHDIYAGDKSTYIAFDVTKAAIKWMKEPSSNHGLIFADGFEENNYEHYTTLRTSLYGNYPMLTMTYRVVQGLESYWETYPVTIPGAGTAHVNLYTGDLTLDLPIFADSAQRMPFAFNLVYNSADKSTNVTDNCHGPGWRSNILQSITPPITDIPNYVYIDADGTPHYFITDSSGKLIDEDGLGLTLTTGTGTYVLTDENRVQYTFDANASGRITKIADPNSNQITFTYSSSGVTVTSTGSRTCTLVKDSNKYITSFTSCLGETTRFSYPEGLLTEIKYPDGKATSIDYTTDGKRNLKRITGPNGDILEFEWDEYDRIISVTEGKLATGDAATASSTYELVSQSSAISWSNAEKNARTRTNALGITGALVEIDNAAENATVANLLNGKVGWIGLSKTLAGWEWTDGSALTYTNWASGEPNSSDTAKTYAVMNTSGKWATTAPTVLKNTNITYTSSVTGTSGSWFKDGWALYPGATAYTNVNLVQGHKYYIYLQAGKTGDSNTSCGIYFDAFEVTQAAPDWNVTNTYEAVRTYNGPSGEQSIRWVGGHTGPDISGHYTAVQKKIVIDLTAACGAGNEPSLAWCQQNLCNGAATISTPINFPADVKNYVVEYASNQNRIGQKIQIDYPSYSTTQIRFSGKDDVIGNNDDLLTNYLFDEWGRLATVYTTSADRSTVYGIQNVGFTAAKNGKSSNRLTQNVAHGSTALNLLTDGSLETNGVSSYTKTNWSGTSESTLSNISGSTMISAYQGKKAGKLVATSNTGVLAAQQSISLPAGTYTLSGYVRIGSVKAVETGGGAGFGVKVGSTYYYSPLLTGTNAYSFSIDNLSTVAADNAAYIANNDAINEEVVVGWRRLSVTFTLSAASTVQFGAVLKNATGTLRFDALQLETGDVMNAYNLIQNAGFEATATGVKEPTGWTAGSGMADANKVWNHYYSSGDSGSSPIAGTKAYSMVGRVTYGTPHDTGLTQTIPIRGEVGDVYTISGWVRLWSATPNAYPNAIYQIACRIKYSNGASATIAKAKANPYALDWQYVSESFALKNDQGSGVTITGLEVVLQMDNVPFYAAFDNIHLVKDEGRSYTYDTEGKLVSTQALKEQKANVVYNETTDLPTSYTDVDGNVTTYEYNENTRNLKKTTAPSGTVTELTYNENYGATPSGQTITGGSLSIKTSQEMIDGGNFAYSTTDALGKTSYIYYNIYDPDYTGSANHILPDPRTAYPYVTDGTSSGADGYTDKTPTNNRLTGQIFAAVDAEGNTTIYSYTDADELESVSNGLSSVSYTYNDATGQLSSIANGDAVYNFTYNDYGATESIKAGNTDIAVNTYRPNNGKLLSTEFAGTTLNYTYDALNQVTQKSYTGGDTVNYKYDGNGNLVQSSQNGGVTWDFVYDNAGMLLGSARDDDFWSLYRYDAAGRTLAFLRVADSHTRRTAFAYNKFEQASHVKITGGTAEVNGTNTYDTLGRLTKKQWTRGDGTVFSTNTYKAGPNGTTSTQLDTVQFGSGTSTVDAGRKYLYDNNGNIVQEQHLINGSYTGKVWYTYDAASQLIRVNDNVNGETVLYTYDTQGNITRRTYHAYADEDDVLGAATRTDTWNYGGPDGNTLISSTIDGVTTNYTYPHFGIPSNWTGNRTLTWRNGRTLASIGNTSFTYDGEGQRVSKTTGGVTTEYIYEGDKLVMQKQGNTSLFFLYDTSGIFGFDLIKNGSTTGTYYYRTDGKGEIIALTDANGIIVANYIYDAWGTPTGITDANGNAITDSNSIGIINPIRYKGYCYDTETGLYYLNSRYYDPEICRFINADSIIPETRETVQGYNLFAYCFNNPVNMFDYTGSWPEWLEDMDQIANDIGWIIDITIVQPIEEVVKNVKEDIRRYDGSNCNEIDVFSANYFSCYKGTFVLKTSFDASFSFGFIGLSAYQQNTETLNHEYGHKVQFDSMGVGKYITNVAVPSVTANILHRMGKLPFDYYGSPWEADADRLGGVNRTRMNTPWPKGSYTSYRDLLMMF